MRKLIGDILTADEEIELVGVATNGLDGEKLAMKLKPDVVITDMVMSDYDGMYVVTSLMDKQPVPIILLSSLEKTDTRIFDALSSGAFEFIDKPTDYRGDKMQDYHLSALVKQASRTDIGQLKAKRQNKNNHHHSFESGEYEIVVIGASTGGPGAVEHILTNLPRNLHIPVVVVQHMPARFIETFAERLNQSNTLQVKLATKGEELKGGVIYVAPGDTNMRIERSVSNGAPIVTFTQRKYKEFNDPSVDCLFESVADTYGKHAIGVILTGMGRDGAAGLKRIREEGGYTIVQDEESSVVYGMPKAAHALGAARQVVNLKEMPGFITSCL